ncbi:MAG: cation:proton antiporter [Lachnospiraceae bacterium]
MEPNTLTYLSFMIAVALLAGKVVKMLHLPNVTGYLVVGIIVGPYGTGLISADVVDQFRNLISDVALGFIAFSIGEEFSIKYLKKIGKSPIVIAIFEALTATLLVDITFILYGCDITLALAIGSIASATAAASTLMIVKQYKASGPVTNTLLPVVAIDDAVALIAFGISISMAKVIGTGDFSIIALLDPLKEIFGGILFGAILGFLQVLLVKWYTGRGNRLALTIALVCFCVGGSNMFGFSSLLACMMMSAIFTNFSGYTEKIFEPLDRTTPPIYMLFFVISGASLDITIIPKVGVMGILYIVVRVVGKVLGAYVGARLSHAEPVVQKYLGFTLVPQEGVAIGLVTVAMNAIPKYANTIHTVVLCGIVVYELIGPLITKLALKAAKEI